MALSSTERSRKRRARLKEEKELEAKRARKKIYNARYYQAKKKAKQALQQSNMPSREEIDALFAPGAPPVSQERREQLLQQIRQELERNRQETERLRQETEQLRQENERLRQALDAVTGGDYSD